ncbi:MAG: hypothetical protein R2764_04595 [Bacteroidales bacterium]
MHTCNFEEYEEIAKNFTLYKVNKKLESIPLQEGFFNLIYFDAFAPDIQPSYGNWKSFKRCMLL